MNLTSEDVLRFVADGGYSVAIYLDAYDRPNNQLLDSSININFKQGATEVIELTLGLGIMIVAFLIN